MKVMEYFCALLVNLLAGILLYYWLPFFEKSPNRIFIIVAIIIITTLFTLWFLLFRKLYVFRRVGIINNLSSMTKGKGSTESILKTVQDDFSFMGIAARKWINTGSILDNVIRKVASRNNTVRFLLLNPDSDIAKKLSQTLYGNSEEIPELIRDSIRKFKSIRKKGYNIELKLYSFLPIFRLALVDNIKIYIGFYRSTITGEDSPQLILDRHYKISYFQPFFEYFEDAWRNQSIDINWDEEE